MLILVALLGWFGGALANFLADSLPNREPLHQPVCHACGAPRPVPAWSALLGLLAGARRCAHCGRQRPLRDVLVELAAILCALAIFGAGLGPSGPWVGLLVGWIFLLIVVIDIRHRLILHVVSLPAAVVIGAIGILDPGRGWEKTLVGGGVGFVGVLFLFLFGGLFARWVAHRRGTPLDEVAFGFGDVTLSGVIGLLVGWPGVVLALFIGVLGAGAFSLLYMLIMMARRRYTPYLPIPYGPFLVLGASLVYFGGRGLFAGIAGG